MAAYVGYGIIIRRLAQKGIETLGVLPQCMLVLEKVGALLVVLERFDRGWVERGFTAAGRSDGDIAVWRQDVVRVRELGLLGLSVQTRLSEYAQ